MKLENYTKLDSNWLRDVIRAVKPSNCSSFDVAFKNCAYGHRGRAYTKGCSFSGRFDPYIIVALGRKVQYPYTCSNKGAYLGVVLYSLEEAAVFITAHELRHLWQRYVPKGRRVWGSKGQYSERDADAYGLKMLRAYRRGELL
jgi:hypothetical protein